MSVRDEEALVFVVVVVSEERFTVDLRLCSDAAAAADDLRLGEGEKRAKGLLPGAARDAFGEGVTPPPARLRRLSLAERSRCAAGDMLFILSET